MVYTHRIAYAHIIKILPVSNDKNTSNIQIIDADP